MKPCGPLPVCSKWLDPLPPAMADYNLLVLPVLDRDDHQIGVLTIDDILEAAIAPERRRRG